MQSLAGPRRRSLLKPLLIAALCLLTHSSNAAPTEGTKMVAAREALPNATPDMDALTDDLSRREYTNGDQACDTNTQTGQTVTCKDGKPVTTEESGQPDTSKLFSIHTSIDTSGGWDAIQQEISTNKTAAYLLCIDLLGKSFRQKYAGRYFRHGGKAKRAEGDERSVQALCDSAGIKCDADGNILPGEGSVEDICHKRTGGGPPEVAAIESSGKSEVGDEGGDDYSSGDDGTDGTNTTAVTTEPAGGWVSDEQRMAADDARGKEDEKKRAEEEAKRRTEEEAQRQAADDQRRKEDEARRAAAGYKPKKNKMMKVKARKERRTAQPQGGDGVNYNADGSYITADQAVHYPDGSYKTPDGAIHKPDGSYTTNDGVVHQADGSYTTADGAVHKADGSYTLADGTAYNADGSLVSGGAGAGDSGDSGVNNNTATGIEKADPQNKAQIFTLDTTTDSAVDQDDLFASGTGGIEMADPNHRGGPQPKRKQFAGAYLRKPGKRSAGAEEAFDIEGAGVAGEDLGRRFDAREAKAEEGGVVERRTERKFRGGQLRRMVAAENA